MRRQSTNEDWKQHYESSWAGDFYEKRDFLHESERLILSHFSEAIAGKAILDIGVGGGRTTPFLLELADSYIGIDCSGALIERCRKRFAGVDFRCCDAANMDMFGDETFDFVLFSSNGIDHGSVDERVGILQEIRRVLRTGGLFAFSSGNLHSRVYRSPYRFPGRERLRNPVRLMRGNFGRIIVYVIGIINYQTTKKRECFGEHYAIRANPIFKFGLTTHYSTMRHQKKQLEDVGFHDVGVISFGSFVTDVDEHRDDPWLYYTARKK